MLNKALKRARVIRRTSHKSTIIITKYNVQRNAGECCEVEQPSVGKTNCCGKGPENALSREARGRVRLGACRSAAFRSGLSQLMEWSGRAPALPA
jgi:hypothetical protein